MEQPGIHFGKYGNELPDWTADKVDVTLELQDNDEDIETPKDVIAILGFDPDDI